MHKLKLILVVFLSLAVAGISVWKFYSSFYFTQIKNPIIVEFKYMQYDCGDCYPQWNVQKVISDKKMNHRFKDIDRQVYIQNIKLDEVLADEEWNCIICSEFIINGKVEKTLSGRYKFIANSLKLIKDKSCCDN